MMWYEEMFQQMEQHRNEKQAKKMSAYMKDQFPFLGLPKDQLKTITKQFMKECRKSEFDWKVAFVFWEKPYREAQYIGIQYVTMHEKEFTSKDLKNIQKLITKKSWWETVDSLDSVVGNIVLREPKLKKEMLKWSLDDNIWLRRVAIDFQQRYKEETDAEVLSQVIQNNFGSQEFFVNKAIGWSLREYSKVNANWVREFIDHFHDRLAPLSIKEGSKYL